MKARLSAVCLFFFIIKISFHSYAHKTNFHNEVHSNSEMAYLSPLEETLPLMVLTKKNVTIGK